MYRLPIVSPDITVYVSAICITRMETQTSIVHGRVSYPSVSVLYYPWLKQHLTLLGVANRYGQYMLADHMKQV